MKRILAIFAVLILSGCATQEPTHVTPVPGEKPVALATPPPVEVKVEAKSEKSVSVTVSKPKPPEAVAGMRGFAWDPNPAGDNVTAYKVYQVKGTQTKLMATITTTDYHPAKKGTYYVTAVNGGGEGKPSSQITL